jgi:hypothetical protein
MLSPGSPQNVSWFLDIGNVLFVNFKVWPFEIIWKILGIFKQADDPHGNHPPHASAIHAVSACLSPPDHVAVCHHCATGAHRRPHRPTCAALSDHDHMRRQELNLITSRGSRPSCHASLPLTLLYHASLHHTALLRCASQRRHASSTLSGCLVPYPPPLSVHHLQAATVPRNLSGAPCQDNVIHRAGTSPSTRCLWLGPTLVPPPRGLHRPTTPLRPTGQRRWPTIHAPAIKPLRPSRAVMDNRSGELPTSQYRLTVAPTSS